MFGKVLNTPLILKLFTASTHRSDKFFFKNYLKHQSVKLFIAVFTTNYSDEIVDNVNFFKPKDPITI